MVCVVPAARLVCMFAVRKLLYYTIMRTRTQCDRVLAIVYSHTFTRAIMYTV